MFFSRPALPQRLTPAVVLLMCAVCLPAHAADHFLTFGGGYAPSGNQLSLERNVQYFQRVLQGLGRAENAQTILFADGNDAGRDLVELAPDEVLPEINLVLSEIFDDAAGVDEQYRSHKIDQPHEACNLKNLDAYFDTAADQLAPGDRMMIYFTGHGGKAKPKSSQNTLVHLWNRQDLSMRDFVKRLDKLPATSPVVMVMVQCYAGGFANVIFNEGDPDKGLSDAPRCGFFATVHDRPAAGCTAAIDEAEFEEYSSCFWAALLGVNRLGEKVDKPDYNHDGVTSFNEAHAYTQLTEDSIDIGVKTSDALLRKYSSVASDKHKNLFDVETSYARLHAVADPAERAVLEGLSDQLKLHGEDRGKSARQLKSKLIAEEKGLKSRTRLIEKEYDKLRKNIARALCNRWPELDNPWNPQVCLIMHNETDDILDAVYEHRDYDRLEKLRDDLIDLDIQRDTLERKIVKCMRFLYVAESVALAHNLPIIAEQTIVDRYRQLRQLEAGTLAPIGR
ncbi:hypothetical protein HED60_09055 [Planctomycetales bacterium ZRK34]|nr:hypothetical protein HED60_09055 [Planctomycetales bacterium ZRK34]